MPFKRVLIVDDSADDVFLTKRALQRLEHPPELQEFLDPLDALAFLRDQNSVLPDLVLLDIRMPRVNGFELLSLIRENPRTEKLCVVMLTSSGESPDLESARKLHANSYLVKPVDPHAYLDIVGRFGQSFLTTGHCPNYWPE